MTEEKKSFHSKYSEITIYTDEYMIKVKDSLNGNYSIMPYKIEVDKDVRDIEKYPLVLTGKRIIEYPMNQSRIGDIELVMSITDAINQVKSNNLDGIDQFIQSLLVFINQTVDAKEFRKLVALGAVEVSSSDSNRPADVKLLTSQMNHADTKVVTDDLYNSALSILAIPKQNQKASGGDTGEARLLGEGWTMAYQRAKQDDLSFKKSEREFLKTVLKICKADTRKADEKIKNLKISDIDIRIPRDKSDNLLVKAQALLNLLQSGVHPEVAFSIVGLFGDPHDVYQKSAKFQGEDFWKKIKEKVDKMAEKEAVENKSKTTSSGEGNDQTDKKDTVSSQE